METISPTPLIPMIAEQLRQYIGRINNCATDLHNHADRLYGSMPEQAGREGPSSPASNGLEEITTVLNILGDTVNELETQASRNVGVA